MEDTQLDNPDVDVEKLISFIKKKAQKRKAQEPASEQLVSSGEQTTDPDLPAVTVDPAVPPKPDGVFKAQADFNLQLMSSLTLLENCIQSLPQDLARIERRLYEETVRSLRSIQQIKDQMGDLPRIVEDLKAQTEGTMVLASETERRISRELHSVTQGAQAGLGAVQERLEKESRQTADLIQKTSDRISTLSDDVVRIRHEIDAALDHFSKTELEVHAKLSTLEQKVESHLSSVESLVIHRLDEMRIRVLRAERVTDARKTPIVLSDPVASTGMVVRNQTKPSSYPPNGNGLPEVASSSDRLWDSQPFDYFLFEHRFRGPVAEIKRHHMIYLDLFQSRKNVLDLGCGRGEFVELLAEHGVQVTGVDIDEDMVDFCRDRGLNVLLIDLFSHLKSLSDNSLDGIFTSQVVEHLSFAELLELIGLCGRKLKPSGIIVAETINPNCFDALSNFYLDPSHVRPIPAKMMWFLLEQKHFRAKSLIFSAPVSSHIDNTLNTNFALPEEVSLYKDYALVAAKV